MQLLFDGWNPSMIILNNVNGMLILIYMIICTINEFKSKDLLS